MKIINRAVVVGALGYFVDIYDLVLFSVVRIASLKDLGVPEDELLDVGVKLLNWQMAGLLLGGLLWGVLGDKRGRVSVLFGSIFLYSAANILNGFVVTTDQYAILRFIAGIGLAGELGAAITLVAEAMPKEIRGYGTAVVAGIGVLGAVAAGLFGDYFPWRTAYFIGGGLGILILSLRMKMFDSGIFEKVRHQSVRKGDLRLLIGSRKAFFRYLRCILIGVPIWYVVGILVTFSPEICRVLGATEPINAGYAILFMYTGLSLGDIGSGILSQYLRSRRKVVLLSLGLIAASVLLYLSSSDFGKTYFYALCVLLGVAGGYWAIFVTVAAEQFGTNLRATVAITAPNFVRGSVILLTSAFHYLKGQMDLVAAAAVVGIVVLTLAFWAAASLEETFGRDLDFVES